MGAATVSVDEFQALEQKVLQTVELIKMERAAKSAFQAESVAARAEIAALEAKLAEVAHLQYEIDALHREREAVRLRVGKMLATLDGTLDGSTSELR